MTGTGDAGQAVVERRFGPWEARDVDREVLLTDGLGGFSLGSLAGVPTRCYGALNASRRPPVDRFAHLVAPLEELSAAGGGEVALHALEVAPDAFEGRGLELLAGVTLRDLLPEREQLWRGVRVTRRAFMPPGSGTVVYLYDIEAREAVTLTLGGFFVDRDMHDLHRGVPDLRVQVQGRRAAVTGGRGTRVRVVAPDAVVHPLEAMPFPQRVYYRYDRARGEPDTETVLGARLWQVQVPAGGARVALVVSAGLEGPDVLDPWAAYAQEAARRRALVEGAWAASGVRDEVVATLAVAADAYLVQRAQPPGRSVIAGYPWFADWGRDAMISLTGLTLLTGRAADARSLLGTFLQALRRGLTPNNFHEDGGGAGYNTVDGALWLVVALERYVALTGDLAFAREALPQVRELLRWHLDGTDHGIRADREDGLLWSGEAGVQLTWMDVKIHDWVVTPRSGKPVEIQALWLGALAAEERLSEGLGQVPACSAALARARGQFGKLWRGEQFADFLTEAGGADLSVRPNVALALALPDTPVSGVQLDLTLRLIESQLLTPVGLHTLSPLDARYLGNYGGVRVQRDAAYHQGTVWAWPLASYVDLLLRGGEVARARAALSGLTGHLWEAGVGHVSEVFSGDSLRPGGCPFQAWSVAEFLRAHVLVTQAESRAGAAGPGPA